MRYLLSVLALAAATSLAAADAPEYPVKPTQPVHPDYRTGHGNVNKHTVQDALAGPPMLLELELADVVLAIDVGGGFTLVVTHRDVIILEGLASDCIETAMTACGRGKICDVRIVQWPDGTIECIFNCQDGHGKCPKGAAPR